MLHVDLAGLIARERNVEPGQAAVLPITQPLQLVEKVAGEMPVAVDEPVIPALTQLTTVLDECPVGRNARTGTNHDDWCAAVGR